MYKSTENYPSRNRPNHSWIIEQILDGAVHIALSCQQGTDISCRISKTHLVQGLQLRSKARLGRLGRLRRGQRKR